MFKMRNNRKTRWETIEELKNKKLEQRNLLINELQKTNNGIRSEILNENSTDELTRIKNEIQNKLRNIDDEITFLEEEQSMVELEHYKTKMEEIQESINQKLEEIKPHRIKYENAKKQFEKTEAEWFEIHSLSSAQIRDLSTKKRVLEDKIDNMEH